MKEITQLSNDDFFVQFDYDKDLVDSFNGWRGKELEKDDPNRLRGVHFQNGNHKGWIVPNKYMAELAGFAKRYGFEATVLEGDLNPRWVGVATSGDFYLQFPYDPALIKNLRTINGSSFNTEYRVWFVPSTSEKELEKFAKKNDFVFTERVRDFVQEEVEEPI